MAQHNPPPAKTNTEKKGPRNTIEKVEYGMEKFVFFSRWIQAPIYLGLIIGSILYSIKFFVELYEMGVHVFTLSEEHIMLGLLSLVDMTMVLNLVIIVVIGGYWTFVSKIDIQKSEDKPEWLMHINPNTLKVKLIISLASISGVHLLKTFINLHDEEITTVILQMMIHLIFVITAFLLAKLD